MATSLTPKQVDLIESRWGMQSASALVALPTSGASVFRWSNPTARLFEVSSNVPPHSVIVSIVLQPMRAKSYIGDREIWSGPVQAGSLRLMRFSPRAPLGFQCSNSFDLLHIHIPFDGIRTVARRFGIDFSGSIAESMPLYLSDELGDVLGEHFVKAMAMPLREGRMYADGITQSLISHLLLNYQHARRAQPLLGSTRDALQLAFDRVTRSPEQRIEVAQLAELAGMSKHHFSRQFSLRFGLSPHSHLIATRLQQAKIRLEFTDQSILQIAMDCGFSDASHFGRAFRNSEGMTPTDYRLLRRVR